MCRRVFRRRQLAGILIGLHLCVCGVSAAAAADELRHTGDALELLLPAGAFALCAARQDGDGARQFLAVATVDSVVTYGLKVAVVDRGPDGDPHAFPSGHTSISVATAEFLRRRYGWGYGAPAYAAAALVGYSRIASKAHDLDDVIGGAAIGYLSAAFFTTSARVWQVQAGGGRRAVEVAVTRRW